VNEEVSFSVSEFVGVFNQTLDYAYPSVNVVGELANFRVSKNRWVYFDLKDENSSVKFFGTVYKLPGPLEDGMILKVSGQPRLHNLYGFSVNVLSIVPSGEGSLLKAATLLESKLAKEGLFDPVRKRSLAYPPRTIGLITSDQSAAYADFRKIINARWQGINIDLINVQVQGIAAPSQIILALEHFNASAKSYDVLVLIRGGGSADDLAAFSTEQVTRAVAASRIPTLVAIGHEVDISLAEMAADQRASTPSNAAELLVPDKNAVNKEIRAFKPQLNQLLSYRLDQKKGDLTRFKMEIDLILSRLVESSRSNLTVQNKLLEAYNPTAVLKRGYSIIRSSGRVVKDAGQVKSKDIISVQLVNGKFEAEVK
jgi:exodeoxyribonuclease VII large subunit